MTKKQKQKEILRYHQLDLRLHSRSNYISLYCIWKEEKGYDVSYTLFDMKVKELDEILKIFGEKENSLRLIP